MKSNLRVRRRVIAWDPLFPGDLPRSCGFTLVVPSIRTLRVHLGAVHVRCRIRKAPLRGHRNASVDSQPVAVSLRINRVVRAITGELLRRRRAH